MCVFGVKRNVDENVEELAKKLIQGSEGLGMYDVTVVRATRGGVRDTKQGILKIELKSENEKIVVLRNKHKLEDSQIFSKVYIRQSHSHAEQVMERNTKTLLNYGHSCPGCH